MGPSIRAVCVVLLCLCAVAHAQSNLDPSENTNLYLVNPGGLWRADSLWLGATFLRDTAEPLKVRFDNNQSGWSGDRRLMVPGGVTG